MPVDDPLLHVEPGTGQSFAVPHAGRCIDAHAFPVTQVVPIALAFPLAPQQICPAPQSWGRRQVIAPCGHDPRLPHAVDAVDPESGRVAQHTCAAAQRGVQEATGPPPLLLLPPPPLDPPPLPLELPAPLLPPPEPLPPAPLLPPELPPFVPLLDPPLLPAAPPLPDEPLASASAVAPPPLPLLVLGAPLLSPNPDGVDVAHPVGSTTPADTRNNPRAHFMVVDLTPPCAGHDDGHLVISVGCE